MKKQIIVIVNILLLIVVASMYMVAMGQTQVTALKLIQHLYPLTAQILGML